MPEEAHIQIAFCFILSIAAKFDEKTYDKVEKSIAEVAGPRYGRFLSAMELKKAMK